jgi:2-C-methyl-D-erythritol 4-phosphate cytidylyltransferase
VSDQFAGAVIVAAGRGERFGDSGKVLSRAAGRPLLAWSLDAATRSETIREIVVVCGDHTRTAVDDLLLTLHMPLPVLVCTGGARRQDSVRAGLGCLGEDIEVAVIHDAARPLATPAMFDAVAQSARAHGAAIIAVPVTDTIKQADGDRVLRTVPRDDLRAAQTPQAFRRDLLARAMTAADRAGETFTDEAALLEWAGSSVVLCRGAASNIKVTVPDDLVLVDALLRERLTAGATDASS